MPRYLIGIDLGTTNCALAYVDVSDPKTIRPFPIPQLVAPAETAARALLPSFLYLPGPHDLPVGATALPWASAPSRVVGEFARLHGARIPGRLVTSAKSWLCHAGVDRSAKILPWSAPPDVERVSPVEASACYLQHMVQAWNHVMARDHPEHRLEQLPVVLTVPASFDDVARALTVEAARRAGLENVTLLEEPQAAFYCWLATHSPQEAAQLRPGDQCLVIDVGGGTSDFSLIQAIEHQGELGFARLAVGDHLLLGGDNMDLALAKYVEQKLPAAGKLDAVGYGLLTQACRQAKEALLSPAPPSSYSVTVMGRGRHVVGGAVTTQLTAADVRGVILDGFFPKVLRESEPQRGARVGLHEMGLPYVSDPAITRHLAGFLRKHLQGGADAKPRAILFNGGVFTAAALRDRVVEVLHSWFDEPRRPWQPLVLTNPSLDLAVAWGAAHFAWLKHSGGRRIGGGIARSYYLAVADQASAADARPRQTVVCVVPQRLEEGHEIVLDEPQFELALGQPVAFPLYTSTVRGDDRAGQLLDVHPEQLLRLPPLHTILRGGKRSGTKSVPVTLAARCTEIGTLELFCVAKDGGNRWRLEFNVRDIVRDDDGEAPSSQAAAPADVWPEEQVQQAGRLIRASFHDEPGAPAPSQLTKALETALDAGRQRWPTALCRRLWDFFLEVGDRRRASPAHLARWNNLVGFCLRPGFGDPLDKYRVEQLWKLIHASKAGGKAMGPPEGGAEFWIMWRRVAGGLKTELQQTLFNRLRPVLLPTKNVARPPTNEWTEMWRAAASLERLDVKVKEQLGAALLRHCRRSPTPSFAFFGLTRLGARVLLYGPLNAVVHPRVVEDWLDALLAFTPGHDNERLAWAFCLSQLARRSGQRAIDVDDDHRRRVLAVLHGLAVPEHWAQMVEEVAELEAAEQDQMFGEALPIGLRLVRSGA
ncbi:MAG: hsp70 family protein [Gemmataceae bacterium]|nr:hsp70 family protein [Gemmataceae bacterium]